MKIPVEVSQNGDFVSKNIGCFLSGFLPVEDDFGSTVPPHPTHPTHPAHLGPALNVFPVDRMGVQLLSPGNIWELMGTMTGHDCDDCHDLVKKKQTMKRFGRCF